MWARIVIPPIALVLTACVGLTSLMALAPPSSLTTRPDGINVITSHCISTQCDPVTKTDDSEDEEGWRFQFMETIRNIHGIPFGKSPWDVYVLGPKDNCTKVSDEVAAKGIKIGKPCEGPFYFKRG